MLFFFPPGQGFRNIHGHICEQGRIFGPLAVTIVQWDMASVIKLPSQSTWVQ